MSKTYSIVVKTTPEAAYAYVADVLSHPEWSPDDMTVTAEQPGPVRVGSTFKASGKLLGKQNPSTVEVTAMQPASLFAFKATDGNSVVQHEFEFRPGEGGTRIDRRVTFLKTPAAFSILFPLFHPFVIGPGNMKTLSLLKDRLEANAPPTTHS